ncbi:MAG: hypothetical protein QF570_12530 [Myxococcota bacterium]|jgi:hypothetical protein|nr:hypothetical protein [Myxococcota bacterium]
MRLFVDAELDWPLDCETFLQAIRRGVDAGRPLEVNLRDRGPERDRAWFTVDDLGLTEHVRFLETAAEWSEAAARADLVISQAPGAAVTVSQPGAVASRLPKGDPAAMWAAFERLCEPVAPADPAS